MSKKQINIRVNDMTRAQIDELVDKTGMSITELITLAVDRLYRSEFSKGPSDEDVSLAIDMLKKELESPAMVRAIMGE